MINASNPSNLSTNYRLQKWTSAGVALICALTIIGTPSSLYSSEEQITDPQIEEMQTSKSIYETHLPKEIYEICLEQKLLDKSDVEQQKKEIYQKLLEISGAREQQNSDGKQSSSIEETDKKEKKAQKRYYSLKGMLLMDAELMREQHNSDGAHTLGIKSTTENGKPYVSIYYISKTDDPIKGAVLGYSQGTLMAYAFFDEKGRDFVAEAPFTNNTEFELNNVLLERILPIFQKVD